MPDSAPATSTIPLVDVLASVPVNGALFTTYTLSLAWFETYLLRSLERSGAREILVLADPFGVDASLGEALVAGPGLRYTVEPVEAPNGAFHAKVAVLWSSEALVVAVGSGNLTYSGMHRNLECWEVLTAGLQSASDDRLLARDIGESLLRFLGFVRHRVDDESRAAATLQDAMRAVERWLPKLPTNGPNVRWLDSTRETIGRQLVRELGLADGRTLQALSPFHDVDGSAVIRLGRELGASIELLYTGGRTTFPLESDAASRAGVVARSLELDDDAARPLHAKVFHVVENDGTAHIVSGSANATTKALWTTDNTEVSLLRAGRFDDLLASSSGTPEVVQLEYTQTELTPLRVLWAHARDASVSGRFRWRLGESPPTLSVGFVDTLEEPVEIPWPSDGRFRVDLPRSFNSLRPRALRIELTAYVSGRRFTGRAWIAFHALLDATREQRSALNAWNRLLDHEVHDHDDDDEVLLLEFAKEHARTIESLGSGQLRARGRIASMTPSSNHEAQLEEVSIPLALLDAMALAPKVDETTGQRSAGDGSLIADVERAMREAFGLLSERGGYDNDNDPDDPDSPSKPARRPKLGRSVRNALNKFEAAFVEAANAVEKTPEKPTLVLAYSALCMRLVLSYRLRDDQLKLFWKSVQTLVKTLLCPLAQRAPLVSILRTDAASLAGEAAELLALLVALLAWRNDGGHLDGDGVATPTNPDVLREALATLDRVVGQPATPAPLPPRLEELFGDSPERLETILMEMRATEAASEHVLRLRARAEAVFRGELAPTPDDPELIRHANRREPLYVTPWITTCPRCHQVLAGVLRGPLLMREAVKCRNTRCSRWLLPSEGV